MYRRHTFAGFLNVNGVDGLKRAAKVAAKQLRIHLAAMADTRAARQAVAESSAMRAQPDWLEELGRDASAAEAHLVGADSSTICVGVLS